QEDRSVTSSTRRPRSRSRRLRDFQARLRLELLEDRNLLDGAFWYAVFQGITPGTTLDKQTEIGRHLLESHGIPDSEIHVERALALTGPFLRETPVTPASPYTTPTALRSVIDTRLGDVPGYSVLGAFGSEEEEHGEDEEGERPGEDFINFEAIEGRGPANDVN